MVSQMTITTKNNVVLFLLKVKMSLFNSDIDWVPRIFDGITELGIDLNSAIEILNGLTPEDYYRGPSPDFNGDGTNIWEFVYVSDELKKIPIYIKLKLQNNNCKVLSFHKSIKPYKLPYNHDFE